MGRIAEIVKQILDPTLPKECLPALIEELSILESLLPERAIRQTSAPGFVGKTFVIIGRFKKSKALLRKGIMRFGGKVIDDITKTTDYAIVGVNGRNRAETAKQNGLHIITEEAAYKIFLDPD